ncbi:MAG TPA: penicillin-binding transpeptidase domain-containing protein [Polyangia bacterium]|nr:penicillin-binding transpeptidase domain-containing protein [Polyangia bacterium]
MLRQLKVRRHVATSLCLLTVVALVAARGFHDRRAEAAPPALIQSAAPHFERAFENSNHRSNWSHVKKEASGYVDVRADGSRAELTLDPTLQARVDKLLRAYPTPYAAAVVLSVEDGRVLAMAAHSTREPDKSVVDLVMKPWAPAASIFKLVTATALVERGVSPDTRVCYHDGVHSVEESNLRSIPRIDRTCNSFAYALAKSQNAIIARLAHDHLSQGVLERVAHALGFGTALPFAFPTEASTAHVPEGGLPFARTAAGFWNTTLSPLHGAYLAATLARGGVTPPLRLIDRVIDRQGNTTRPAAAPERRVVEEAAARAVGRMMVGTTEYGTARLGFRDKRTNRPLLPGIAVAGKTGSLDRHDPYVAYSWFVGFAPADRPEVAVAVLLGNGADWHVKAHQVAREVLSDYFEGERETNPHMAAR